MRMRTLILTLALIAGCGQHHDSLPLSTEDLAYPNGHPLAVNETEVAELETSLIEITNQRRIDLGLSPLTVNETLGALARAHSQHMIVHHFYGHVNPEGDGPGERFHTVAGDVQAGLWENVWLTTSQDMNVVFQAFWDSPDHRDALLSPSSHIGVGLWVDTTSGANVVYVTMEFLRVY